MNDAMGAIGAVIGTLIGAAIGTGLIAYVLGEIAKWINDNYRPRH